MREVEGKEKGLGRFYSQDSHSVKIRDAMKGEDGVLLETICVIKERVQPLLGKSSRSDIFERNSVTI